MLLAAVFAVAAVACGADDAVTATATLHGRRVKFPESGLVEGAKATITLLESCHALDDMTPSLADLKKSREGDHVRLVFAKPVRVTILEKTFDVSELVFTQPSNTGVFWLRAGRRLVRCAKFEPRKEASFDAWLGQAQTLD
jgi:hypothetical protein